MTTETFAFEAVESSGGCWLGRCLSLVELGLCSAEEGLRQLRWVVVVVKEKEARPRPLGLFSRSLCSRIGPCQEPVGKWQLPGVYLALFESLAVQRGAASALRFCNSVGRIINQIDETLENVVRAWQLVFLCLSESDSVEE